jgi:hypothetical protein
MNLSRTIYAFPSKTLADGRDIVKRIFFRIANERITSDDN